MKKNQLPPDGSAPLSRLASSFHRYRLALLGGFFEARQAALDFVVTNNDRWRESREAMHELIARLKASAEASCGPIKLNPPQSPLRRLFGVFRERLLRASTRA